MCCVVFCCVVCCVAFYVVLHVLLCSVVLCCLVFCCVMFVRLCTVVLYEGHLESKERFAIQRYLLIIGKKKNMQVL